MSRIVQIPPVAAPGSQGGTVHMEVLLSLVDATGTAIPASDASNTGIVHGLGVHVVTDQQYDLELSTQAELTETTYYRVVVRQGRDEWRRDVQIPAGDGSALTWAQFLAFEDPVTANLAWASRLLPTGATDQQVAVWDAATGVWIPADQSGAIAANVVVAFTPSNYTPATPDLEAHLAAIDAALGV